MSNIRIKVSYKIDKRIKVAQLESNQAVCLVPLIVFQDITNILYFEEHIGEVLVSIEDYKTLWSNATWTSKKKSY